MKLRQILEQSLQPTCGVGRAGHFLACYGGGGMRAGSTVNWRAGVKRAAFMVMLAGAVVAGLGGAEGAGIAASAAPVSSPYIFAPPDIVVGESDGFVDLPVTLSAPGESTVSMYYSTVNGTALGSSGSSPCPTYVYGAIAGTLTFPPGVTTQTLRVNINNCGISSPAGFLTFDLSIYSPVNGTIAKADTQVDITGDADTGATPGLYVRDAIAGAGTATIPVVLGGPSGLASDSPVTVSYSTHNGTAVAGTDYTATSGTLTFPPGETAENIEVPIIARSGRAPARSFSVTLSAPANATIASGTGVVTIGASGGSVSSSPFISAPPDVVVGEADGYVDLPVTLSAPSQSAVSMYYSTENGTATGVGGSASPCPTYQYMGVEGTLTFPPGVTTQVVRIAVNNCANSAPFGFQMFSLEVYSPVGGTIARADTQVDISGDVNTGATPALSVRDAVTDTEAGTVTVPVVLGGPSGLASDSPVTVSYSTHNASAVAGTDYTATSGTLTFPPGETAENIEVPIIARSGRAAARSFSVTLSGPANATISDGTGVVTIGASGGSVSSSPFISAPPDVVVGEADGYVDLPVTLSAPSQSAVSMYYSTENGTATGVGGSASPCPTYQYIGVQGTLTFPPGVTTRVVRVVLNNCDLASPGNFTLEIYSPVGGIIAKSTSGISLVENPTAPGAPTAVTATAGNHEAVVAFAAPVSDGGDPVNFYTVTVSPGGAKFSSASSPITVTGLTDGTAYSFRVTATNTVGTGPASAASKTVIPGTPPGAPRAVHAVSGSTKTKTGPLTVTFSAPVSNGGLPIARYTARCTSSNGGATRTGTHSGAAAAPITVASVTTGKTYTCSVMAANGVGSGPASAPSASVVAGAPAAPARVTAARVAAGRIKVSFAPAANNGSPVTSYTASCSSANGGVTRLKSGVGAPLTVTGLTVGKSYTCTVYATNARGKGQASKESGAVTA
jgi:Calx-beta domain/Fibronectin type III domain